MANFLTLSKEFNKKEAEASFLLFMTYLKVSFYKIVCYFA